MTEAERQRDLEALQDAIYRDKVERARSMTEGERLSEAFELTDDPFVQSQFSRRRPIFVTVLGRDCQVPTAEDVVVQEA